MWHGLHRQRFLHARRQCQYDELSSVAGRCVELALSSCLIAPCSRISEAMDQQWLGLAPPVERDDRARPQPGSVESHDSACLFP